MAIFTALLDANVLYSNPVTDFMLELSATGLYRARWSDDIHAEWMDATLKLRRNATQQNVERRRALMDEALPQACVTGYHSLIPGLQLPDQNDAHVLAAAIVGRADVIVTFNLRHFPEEIVTPYGIAAEHPDVFLIEQRSMGEALFIETAKRIRARLTNPPYDADAYLDTLARCGLPRVSESLRAVTGLI